MYVCNTDFKSAVDNAPGSPENLCAELHFVEYGLSTCHMDQISIGEEKDWRSFCERELGVKSFDEAESLSKKVLYLLILFSTSTYVTLGIIWIHIWI